MIIIYSSCSKTIKNFSRDLLESKNIYNFVALEPAKPLYNAQMCGSFFIYVDVMIRTVPFTKEYKNSKFLVSLLHSRGLSISNIADAEQYIEHIGYYRLSAYMYPFLQIPKSQHQYKNGASFNNVMMLYRFDKKLRLLIFNEIEKIEVAIRSRIVNECCEKLDNPFWITDPSNFSNNNKFNKTLDLINHELQKSREDFISHFKNTYSDPYPPAWILFEILPFGIITKIYSNIKNKKIKKNISQYFGLQVIPFESWLTIIALTRNACCHHARVWNKQNAIRATIPNMLSRPWINIATDPLRIYFNICIIKYFLDVVSPNNDMYAKLRWLFVDFPEIDLAAMGFPKGWEMEPLWR